MLKPVPNLSLCWGYIRLSNICDWQISKDANNGRLRDAAYVIPSQPSDLEAESDSDPEESKLAKKYRQEMEISEDEEDIPFMKLRIRLDIGKLGKHKTKKLKSRT